MGVARCFDFAVLFGSDWVFGGVLGTGVFVVADKKKKIKKKLTFTTAQLKAK